MRLNKRRSTLVLVSMLLTFVALRLYLHQFPNSNLDIGAVNIHHLYTGLLLITLGGLPLAMFDGNSRGLDVAMLAFGAGLGMALDEWVYLQATDGSDMAYLLPVSLWGGMIMVGLALAYALVMILFAIKRNHDGRSLRHEGD